MRDNLTNTIEDYLKTIFEITRSNKRASTNQIAKALGVAPASVTGMIKKLSTVDPPLVDYKRHHGVTLTVDGERVALEILRHHRLIEMFLQKILGYEWDQVHAEADRLEHVISEEFEERIAEALGNPSYDPHGDPIPTSDLSLPDTPSISLADLRPGQKAIIRRVSSADNKLLRHLGEIGLVPKTTVKILDYSPFDKNITLQISGQNKPITLGSNITTQIFIEISRSDQSPNN